MLESQPKIKHWPFKKGERAQLIWISTPFLIDTKLMINAYFKSKSGEKKVLLDWGTLTYLVLQYYYIDGDITNAIPYENLVEKELIIHPRNVLTHSRDWITQSDKQIDQSRSFIIKQKEGNFTLPLIEAIRTLVAPNRFLLYQLFDPMGLVDYFNTEETGDNFVVNFYANYNVKYTNKEYVYQLVWLMNNQGLHSLFQSFPQNWNENRNIHFEWPFKDSIRIVAEVKYTGNRETILRIKRVKEKILPASIIINHPHFNAKKISNEPKKYGIKREAPSEENGQLELDEQKDGSNDFLDFTEMVSIEHEYSNHPPIKKRKNKTNLRRDIEDENTKKYFIYDDGSRTTADTGGIDVTKGIEGFSPIPYPHNNELKEFYRLMELLREYPHVQNVVVETFQMPIDWGHRSFVYLSDRVTRREYCVATVTLKTGKVAKVIDVQRDGHSLSMLIIKPLGNVDWDSIVYKLIQSVIKNCGAWKISELHLKGLSITTVKHQGNVIIERLKHIII